MKNKKGFTIIELLAVIAIIAILAVVTVPTVLDVITKSRKGTAQNSAYGLLNAAKNYYASEMADNAVDTPVVFNFPSDSNKLNTKGSSPDSGTLTINPDGRITLAVAYGSYCTTKTSDVDKVTVTPKKGDCTAGISENLITNGYGNAKNNSNFSSFTYNASDNSFSKTSSTLVTLYSDEFIPVDTSKKYELSVDIKSSNTTATYYAGIAEYDIDKNNITSTMYMYLPNSLTTLARDLKKGDTVVYLNSTAGFNNSSSLPTYQLGFIFWNYKDSTGHQYLPLTYSRNAYLDLYTYSNINKTNNTITLKNSWTGNTIPAGTSVSQSSSGSTYNYSLLSNQKLTTSYTNRKAIITGVGNTGSNITLQFRPGTKYVRFFIYNNYNSTANTTTNIRNVSLKEV